MKATKLVKSIDDGVLNSFFKETYGKEEVENQKKRYTDATEQFISIYGDREVNVFSVPGRSEISGNHTDHNYGKVLAGSINLDIIAIASKTDDSVIRIKSKGFDEDVVDIEQYTSPREDNFFKSSSLIAGMARAFRDNSFKVGGYVAYTTSNVFKGSGLSSSAAFEVMIGNILNHLYNKGKVDNVEIAKMAQFAENQFFGKPCGLMDQVACAVGGFVYIDFEYPKSPKINKIDFDLTKYGYSLCIVDTGGNHADLNDDYASVPREMKQVAKECGEEVLRRVDKDNFVSHIPSLREKTGDRAILRALHFFAENERVEKQQKALSENNLDLFFKYVLESGQSSFMYLQNVFTTKNIKEQGLSLALCLTDNILKNEKAAFRVHGGGFAGTIQAFVPFKAVEGYKKQIDSIFGEGACHVLKIRNDGAIKVI